MLGYAANMPPIMSSTTSLGISGTSLVELRNTGKTALSLIYDARLSQIHGQLTLIEKGIKVPLIIDEQRVSAQANRRAITQRYRAARSTAASNWCAPTR